MGHWSDSPWEGDLETQSSWFEYELNLLHGQTLSDLSYSDLLWHPKWKYRRHQILLQRKKCERCGSKKRDFNVHHKRYKTLPDGKICMPWDYEDEDLELLCTRCHKEEHGLLPNQKQILDNIETAKGNIEEFKSSIAERVESLLIVKEATDDSLIHFLVLNSSIINLSKSKLTIDVGFAKKKSGLNGEALRYFIESLGNDKITSTGGSIIIKRVTR